MSLIQLQKNIGFTHAELTLPASKSLSNRALIIQSIANNTFQINQLSNAEDTQILQNLLSGQRQQYDVNAAGTSMRFLVSLLSITPGTFQLTGSPRMQERPIGELVDALKNLGAEIHYLKNEGYPPLEITGKKLAGGMLSIDGGISSQFISSLLLIAPSLREGLELEIRGQMVSAPYIDMTLSLMEYFGVAHSKQGQRIYIQPQVYQPKNYTVEPDWSAAGFWYGLLANGKTGDRLLLNQLSFNSLQGDKKTAEYFKLLGVDSTETESGIRIEKTNRPIQPIHINLLNEPDLFPALAFACATARVTASFAGLDTLNLKESNRIEAVKTELEKTGAKMTTTSTSFEITDYQSWPTALHFNTYNDHRMAMAASICLQSGNIISIHDPEVVNKSYPTYWDDLRSSGIIK